MTEAAPAHLDPAYRAALILCAALNLAMFLIEGGAGLLVGSAALLADAVDFIEDATMLALAVAALRWSARARAGAGVVQGLVMAVVGFAAIGAIAYRLSVGGAPNAPSVGIVGFMALAVNVYCAYRLARFTRGDSSMRATWLSSRNDAILNILTVAAAGVIYLTHSGWPDIVVGGLIAAINLWAAGEVLLTASKEIVRHSLSVRP
jgi:Co/Zn/Cd efflux system component